MENRMIQFSEATAIALHVMIYIANRKDTVNTLKDISEHFSISPNHLSKVLQRLVKAGYLTSTKGPKGGFQIIEGKETSTLLDILIAVTSRASASLISPSLAVPSEPS